MADIDFSKYSNEELMRIAEGNQGNQSSVNQASQQEYEQPGFFKNLGKGYLNYAGGALRGIGQTTGDLGASAINWPISGIEHLIGMNLPHVPHPDLLNKNPGSFGESVGQNLGQITGALAFPGGAGLKAAQLANKGYKLARGSGELPLIGQLLAGGAGGALEGAAGNEDNRGLGGALGAVAGTAGYAIPSAINFAKSLGSKSIAKNIQEEVGRIGHHFKERFDTHLLAGEEAGANKFLKAEKGKIPLFKKAGEGKLAYGLEKFNEMPTLSNAHKAQSDLNKIVSKYSSSKEGSLEHDVYYEALKLKNRLLKKISESFEKAGTKEHGEGYQKTRVEYANQAAPYLDSPTISGLLGKNKRNVQTVRPSEFADKLLQEEEFLAQAGKNHPDLLRREKFNKFKNSKTALIGAGLATGLAAPFLPHYISKALK